MLKSYLIQNSIIPKPGFTYWKKGVLQKYTFNFYKENKTFRKQFQRINILKITFETKQPIIIFSTLNIKQT